MPASAPASSETVRSWRGRPPRKARLQAVCHCQVRKSGGCCARSSSAFQRGSSRASKPARGSIFIGPSGIGPSGIRVACLTARIPQVSAILPGGLVHGGLEIVAEVLPHLLSHALDEARNAGRVVLVEVSELGGVGGGFESGVFRLGGGEPGHEAGELCAATARTSRGAGRRQGAHEQTDASMAALAVVFVDRHARSSAFPALEMPHPSMRLQEGSAALRRGAGPPRGRGRTRVVTPSLRILAREPHPFGGRLSESAPI